jgi:transcriptional regulator with XRE-family HTH domain
MNSNKLKARMVERGINGQTLSREIGISESAFYRKMNGTSEFTQGEIKAIAQALEMDTESMLAIFFADEVS